MKKQFLILALTISSILAYAQISTKQLPPSFSEKEKINMAYRTLSSPDIDALLSEDERNAKFFKPQRCAVAVPMFEDFFDNAVRTSFENYDLYLLKIKIPYAQAIGFSSNNFYLPKGAELYLYNPTHSKVLGAYTKDNDTKEGIFATEYVYGEEIIMEYYQPKEVKEKAKIELSEFVYFYRDVINFEQEQTEEYAEFHRKGFEESGNCNVNINCSEGDNYQEVKNSVTRIQIRGGYSYYWCTGTLLNTTNNSKTPYILSAAHCIQYSSANDYNYFIFYFKYEAPSCSNPASNDEPSYVSYTGCYHLASDSTYGDYGTDYLLMKLKNNLSSDLNPYFAGWSISNTPPSNGVCIHHPSGDIKKISTFTSTPTSAEAYTSTHWRVFWAQTSNGFGIVEGGSSGSGLFNSNGLLVGTLTGGYSDCSNSSESSQRDWYGCFYLQYPYLTQWLNPSNSNVTSTVGAYLNDMNSDNQIVTDKEKISFVVYPSPAKDYVNIGYNMPNTEVVIAILNNLGQSIVSYKIPSNQKNTTINISSLTSGIYFIRLYAEGDAYISKIIKQ